MKYLFLFYGPDRPQPEPGAEELNRGVEAWGAAKHTLVECADLDEALEWAARMPAARDASVEVRQLLDVGVEP
jgi:YCII-related domain